MGSTQGNHLCQLGLLPGHTNELVIVNALGTARLYCPRVHKILLSFCGVHATITPRCQVPWRAVGLVVLPTVAL